MRVLVYQASADTGGVSVAIKLAFKRLAPDWTVHAMVASGNYIDYPVDVPWSQQRLEALYDAADVVQLSHALHAHHWYDNGQGKPTVLMHHGRTGRDYPAAIRNAAEVGCVQVGSTFDLQVLGQGLVEWIPKGVDIPEFRAIREQHYRPGRTVRIGHAPTNRIIKDSDAFDAAIASLRASGMAVEPVVIQGKPWAECLALKATCDVFYDQVQLGYGSNAIEAWAMGLPVIVGVEDPLVREGMLARWGTLPFFEASAQTLEFALRALASDADLREEYARRGMAHVERWHDGRYTVDRLKQIYAAAPRTVPGGNAKRLTPERLAKLRRRESRNAQLARRAAIRTITGRVVA